MNMKRILIVDDDSSVGTMLKFVIAREQLGEVVATVTDEEQAVDEILFYQPDIVLIDLLFPAHRWNTHYETSHVARRRRPFYHDLAGA